MAVNELGSIVESTLLTRQLSNAPSAAEAPYRPPNFTRAIIMLKYPP